jgi:hypothetical protein
MATKDTQQPCDTTRTIYKNPSSTTADVVVEVKDRCNSDGTLTVYDKSNNKVRVAPIAYGANVSLPLQVPDTGRIDLDCNGTSGTGGGCTWSVISIAPAART